MVAQQSARFLGTTSLAVASGAGTSTAVFGSQTYQIRVANDGITPVRFVVGDGPSVSSTVINTTGALLPAGGVGDQDETPPTQRG